MAGLPVTAIYAGVSTLLILVLLMRVVRRRQSEQISLGTGNDPELERRIRAHGNAVETIPLALILLGLAEGLGAPAVALHLLGLMLVLGRLAHALHISRVLPDLRWRVTGMMLTLTMLGVTALGLLAHGLLRL